MPKASAPNKITNKAQQPEPHHLPKVPLGPHQAPALLQGLNGPELRSVLKHVEGLRQADGRNQAGNEEQHEAHHADRGDEQEQDEGLQEVLKAVEVSFELRGLASVDLHHGSVEPKRQRARQDQRTEAHAHAPHHERDQAVKQGQGNGHQPAGLKLLPSTGKDVDVRTHVARVCDKVANPTRSDCFAEDAQEDEQVGRGDRQIPVEVALQGARHHFA